MAKKTIRPAKKLSGTITLPGDKSISHRAIMLGAIADGTTVARGVLDCDDCNYTIHAFREMGVRIAKEGGSTVMHGAGLNGLKRPAGSIYVGESGTTMRLLAGILAGQKFESVLEGDLSLSKRPMQRIIEPLGLMGAKIRSASGGYPPLRIKAGKLKPIDYKMKVASAQVKSAILFAGLYTTGITKVREKVKSRDHTERMMRYFGADIKYDGLTVALRGGRRLFGQALEVPGDISSAAFFMVAATLIKGSKIRINRVSINPTRAGILDVLQRMGSNVKIINKVEAFEPFADIEVSSAVTKGTVIKEEEIPRLIDELPVIFVLAALSSGRTIVRGASELRVKETDRIRSMQDNLSSMGAKISVCKGSLVIEGRRYLDGAPLKSFGDHRTCMAMTVAALAAKGASAIDDVACVSKSFPEFFDVMEGLK
ncbi:MAG: 3-phosphoshikimate 1-carboxyvinyltransferase [Candidatus Omnitrophica bacterium]|nr:3-phosphoshikimate 1-carboxyvinyltransferase [Candidatus Omnitrophota bacterium]MCM8790793.1 3-phosphoshikimate 1-carboxyvinyltransferase [Candidatus Omnitrophota bacterium]